MGCGPPAAPNKLQLKKIIFLYGFENIDKYDGNL
jgi:hypothetical protein